MPLFLFPTRLEAEPFVRLCPDAKVVVSGVGLTATAATLARLYREHRLDGREVVLSGIAGAYSEELALGEVVEVVEECCVELPERFRTVYRTTPRTTLRRATSNSVHRSGAMADGRDIENMEGAALFALAEELSLSATEIRSVSNYVGDESSKWHIEEATESLAATLQHLYYK